VPASSEDPGRGRPKSWASTCSSPEPDRTSLASLSGEIGATSPRTSPARAPEETLNTDETLAAALSGGPFGLGYQFDFDAPRGENCVLHRWPRRSARKANRRARCRSSPPGRRLQPSRPLERPPALRLLQRDPRRRRRGAARSPGDPSRGEALPQPRPGRVPARARRREHGPRDRPGGGRGDADRWEDHPARPAREPPRELPGRAPHVPPRACGRRSRRLGRPLFAPREDRPAGNHSGGAPRNADHPPRIGPARSGDPRHGDRQPHRGRPGLTPPVEPGAPGPPGPRPRDPLVRAPGEGPSRLGPGGHRPLGRGGSGRSPGGSSPTAQVYLPPLMPIATLGHRLHGPHVAALHRHRAGGARTDATARPHAGRHHPEPGGPGRDPSPPETGGHIQAAPGIT
jgi:hypothetical protein